MNIFTTSTLNHLKISLKSAMGPIRVPYLQHDEGLYADHFPLYWNLSFL